MKDQATGTESVKVYVGCKCPKAGCRIGVVKFLDKSEFKNPFRHLKACYTKGKPAIELESALPALYNEAREKTIEKGGSIKTHFASSTLTEYEKSLAGYIRLLVTRNLPLTLVSGP